MKNAATCFKGLSILAVSPISSYGGCNTSIHRIRALESLGCKVDVIDSACKNAGKFQRLSYRIQNRLFRIGFPVSVPDLARDGPRLIKAASEGGWDVIWLDKAVTLDAGVLKQVHEFCSEALIIGFSPDDMNGRHNQSQQLLEALPFYDSFITTKSYNVDELKALGCPDVLFVSNGYDPIAFRPFPESSEDKKKLGGDIGFIGSYEEERAAMMYFLAVNGLSVRVWGGGWHNMKQKHANLKLEYRHLLGDDFAKAASAFKINLGFLRKLNRDLQTTRSVEIPGCGGFMLTERTKEHLELFKENEEAVFFDSCEELLEKCKYYLTNPILRQKIARAGYQRCLASDYSNAGQLAPALSKLMSQRRANSVSK